MKQKYEITQGLLNKADAFVNTQSVPPTALKPILDQHWSTPKNLTPTTPNLDIVQKALDSVGGQCKKLKAEQTLLQQQYNSVNEELKTLKSNVDNNEDHSDEDFTDDSDDRPAPKVNRNSSYDLNPYCLTYVHQHIPNNV